MEYVITCLSFLVVFCLPAVRSNDELGVFMTVDIENPASETQTCPDSPCLNGGLCRQSKCICAMGYSGKFCKKYEGTNYYPHFTGEGFIAFYFSNGYKLDNLNAKQFLQGPLSARNLDSSNQRDKAIWHPDYSVMLQVKPAIRELFSLKPQIILHHENPLTGMLYELTLERQHFVFWYTNLGTNPPTEGPPFERQAIRPVYFGQSLDTANRTSNYLVSRNLRTGVEWFQIEIGQSVEHGAFLVVNGEKSVASDRVDQLIVDSGKRRSWLDSLNPASPTGNPFKAEWAGLYEMTPLLFVGGIPADRKPVSKGATGFHGCMQGLFLNGQLKDPRRQPFLGDALFGFGIACNSESCSQGSECYQVSSDRSACRCSLRRSGPQCSQKKIKVPHFTGRSYLVFMSEFKSFRRFRNEVTLVIRPEALSGLLFYRGDSNSPILGKFLAIGLLDGHVFAASNIGAETIYLKSQSTLKLSTWHNIRFRRTGRIAKLHLDEELTLSESAFSGQAWDSATAANETVFLGGHPNIDSVSADLPRFFRQPPIDSPFDFQSVRGFHGCIKKVTVDRDLVDLIDGAQQVASIANCAAPLCNRDRECSANEPQEYVLPGEETQPTFAVHGHGFIQFNTTIVQESFDLNFRILETDAAGTGRQKIDSFSAPLFVEEDADKWSHGGFLLAVEFLGENQVYTVQRLPSDAFLITLKSTDLFETAEQTSVFLAKTEGWTELRLHKSPRIFTLRIGDKEIVRTRHQPINSPYLRITLGGIDASQGAKFGVYESLERTITPGFSGCIDRLRFNGKNVTQPCRLHNLGSCLPIS